jgi:hypothetical protein
MRSWGFPRVNVEPPLRCCVGKLYKRSHLLPFLDLWIPAERAFQFAFYQRTRLGFGPAVLPLEMLDDRDRCDCRAEGAPLLLRSLRYDSHVPKPRKPNAPLAPCAAGSARSS